MNNNGALRLISGLLDFGITGPSSSPKSISDFSSATALLFSLCMLRLVFLFVMLELLDTDDTDDCAATGDRVGTVDFGNDRSKRS